MVNRYVANAPGDTPRSIYDEFIKLQSYLQDLEYRLAPLWGGVDIEPTGILDPVIWTPLVPVPGTNTIPQLLSVYFMTMRLAIAGSNPNSWIQLRVTWELADGTPQEVLGVQVDIGQNALESVTLSAVVAAGLNIEFSVRGNLAEVLTGKVSVHRIGTGDNTVNANPEVNTAGNPNQVGSI